MRAFVFTDKALGRQAGRFVWLSINTEKRENAPVLAKYPIQASPTFFVLDPAAEKVVLKYVGGATVPQLQRILDDGARAAGHGADDRKPDELLAKADAAYSAGENKEAAEAYRAALKGMATVLAVVPAHGRVAPLRAFGEPPVRGVRGCRARRVPASAHVSVRRERRGLGPRLRARARQEPSRAGPCSLRRSRPTRKRFAEPAEGLAADDVSSLFLSLADAARCRRRTRPARRRFSRSGRPILDGEAAKAKTAEARAVFDAHRLTAYLELGQPERAIPMLEASERDFPDDYNPPARLALAYRAMKKYDAALAASDRALERAYGPRKLVILQARARIYADKGDREAARKTLEDALAWAEALPKEQVSERQVAALKKQLETPR